MLAHNIEKQTKKPAKSDYFCLRIEQGQMNFKRIYVKHSKKLDQTTADMKKLAAALDQEKKKTDMLLYQMLPVKVANQLREGRTVEAGAQYHICLYSTCISGLI